MIIIIIMKIIYKANKHYLQQLRWRRLLCFPHYNFQRLFLSLSLSLSLARYFVYVYCCCVADKVKVRGQVFMFWIVPTRTTAEVLMWLSMWWIEHIHTYSSVSSRRRLSPSSVFISCACNLLTVYKVIGLCDYGKFFFHVHYLLYSGDSDDGDGTITSATNRSPLTLGKCLIETELLQDLLNAILAFFVISHYKHKLVNICVMFGVCCYFSLSLSLSFLSL